MFYSHKICITFSALTNFDVIQRPRFTLYLTLLLLTVIVIKLFLCVISLFSYLNFVITV